MTSPIPVCWLSYRREITPRGSHDVQQFELITARTWGAPPNPLDYSHHIGFDQLPPGADGAVVIIGAQHHHAPEQVTRLNADLARLKWVVLVLAGDECSQFPWQAVEHPNLRLWIMTPRPHLHAESDAFFVGEGYRSNVPTATARFRADTPRGLDYFFAGQITHERRQQMARVLDHVGWPFHGKFIATPGFLQGLPHPEYLRLTVAAKVIPCPSGPCTPDSFRFYEALEAGCVPLADATTPDGWPGYWWLVYGPGLPFPIVEDWSDLPAIMDDVLADWPRRAAECGEWWAAQKARIVQRLDDDVRTVRGE